ncbi:MAG: Gfo/Idh/MocA family protein [Gemmatimonadales bacterium]
MVVGCGLIGRRRAVEAAAAPTTRVVAVVDSDAAAAAEAAAMVGAVSESDWRRAVERPDVDLVCVATPNGLIAEIAEAALAAGKHVLVEKPMGRNLGEAERIRAAARTAARRLKVGFNHRYHPAIAEAKRRLDAGEIGDVINLRCRYGHGGRPGYEKEWRGSRELAGGGELTDQGVHVVDLIHWFAGVPASAFALLQTAVWPLGELEDNGFGLFRYAGGGIAAFHTSWTQWKNLFSFEVFGTRGAVIMEGLGRSYGPETLTVHVRRPEGGAPLSTHEVFEGEDVSWRREWTDFVSAVTQGSSMLGSPEDGVIAMAMLDALYRSARSGVPEAVRCA